MDVSLPETDKEKLIDLMAEINKVDIDVDAIKTQAGELYNTIKNISDKIGDKQNVIESIGSFFGNIVNAIVDFFKGLFG